MSQSNKKYIFRLKLVPIVLLVVLFFTACSDNKYDKKISEYTNIYSNIVSLLDEDDIYKSIIDNDIIEKNQDLNKVYTYLINHADENNCNNIVCFMGNHIILQELIDTADISNTNGHNIILTKLSIKTLKSNMNISIKTKQSKDK